VFANWFPLIFAQFHCVDIQQWEGFSIFLYNRFCIASLHTCCSFFIFYLKRLQQLCKGPVPNLFILKNRKTHLIGMVLVFEETVSVIFSHRITLAKPLNSVYSVFFFWFLVKFVFLYFRPVCEMYCRPWRNKSQVSEVHFISHKHTVVLILVLYNNVTIKITGFRTWKGLSHEMDLACMVSFRPK
jgi:H+/gluconate symporter-like permease